MSNPFSALTERAGLRGVRDLLYTWGLYGMIKWKRPIPQRHTCGVQGTNYKPYSHHSVFFLLLLSWVSCIIICESVCVHMRVCAHVWTCFCREVRTEDEWQRCLYSRDSWNKTLINFISLIMSHSRIPKDICVLCLWYWSWSCLQIRLLKRLIQDAINVISHGDY